jgi:3-dehydroquinate synthase
MALAFDLSARLGLCPATDAARLRRHLTDVGLPAVWDEMAAPGTPDRLLAHMARDKKVRDGKLTFVLADGIGRARIVHDVDPGEVRGLLSRASAA